MNRTYTIPELESLWREVEVLKAEIAELRGKPAILQAARQAAELRANAAGKIFLTLKEAAAMLSISLSTLNQHIARGDLKTRRRGHRLFVPQAELHRFASRDIVDSPWPPKRGGKTVRR